MLSRQFLVLVAMSLSFVTAFAADKPPANPNFDYVTRAGGLTYAIPKQGPLRFKKFEDEGARFAGQIRLTGTYVYGHASADPSGEMVNEPELFFRPDDATRALLPYWFDRGAVGEIYFENPDAFLKAVLTKDMIARVKQRKVHAVTGQAAIWVDNYLAGAVCDTPTYTGRFLRVDQPPQFVARNEFADQLGCG